MNSFTARIVFMQIRSSRAFYESGNMEAAREAGLRAIHFLQIDPAFYEQFYRQLVEYNLKKEGQLWKVQKFQE